LKMGSFSEALSLIKSGKKVTRPSMKGSVVIKVAAQTEAEAPVLQVQARNGVMSHYRPSNADLFAEDWTEVE
jgi:hypothetical protein